MPQSALQARISVIIPAYNDAEPLRRALLALRSMQKSEYPNLEIIVAVKPSSDGTDAIAKRLADVVVPGGRASEGRNRGALAATGNMLLFQDADLVIRPGVLPRIARLAGTRVVGSCNEVPLQRGVRPLLVTWLRNVLRGTGTIKGLSGFIFTDAPTCKTYDARCNVLTEPGDVHPFYQAALKTGARYSFLRMPGGGYAVDFRRYERDGYLRTFWFWVRFGIAVHVGGQDPVAFAKQYWA